MDILYAQGGGSPWTGVVGFFPFILIMVIIYFLMIRPQLKQQKEKNKMLGSLKKGDRVVTAGGVLGMIAGFKDKNNIVILDVDKNVAIEVMKSSISALYASEQDSGEK